MGLKTSIGKSYRPEDCGVLAIEHPALRPDTRVTLVDHSTEIAGNDYDHRRFESHQLLAGTPTYAVINLPAIDLPADHVLVTDRVLPSGSMREESLPLFYEYQAKFDHYSATAGFGGVEVKRYSDGVTLSKREYLVEHANHTWFDPPAGVLHRRWDTLGASGTRNRFRLLLPEYVVNSPDGPWKVHYTQYLRGQTDYSHSEFINAEPIYKHPVDFGIGTIMGVDQPRHSTILSSGTGGVVNLSGTVYVKKADWARLVADHPAGTEWTEWNPKVFGGSLVLKHGDEDYIYNIQRDINYLQPSYTASGGFYKIYDDQGTRIDDKTIQFSHQPMYFRHNSYPEWKPGANPSGTNYGIHIRENGNLIDNIRIKDWASWQGIVELDRTKDFAKYTATYLIENRWLFMRPIDLNPRRRRVKQYYRYRGKVPKASIADNPIHIYIVPKGAYMRGGDVRTLWGFVGLRSLGRVYSADPRDHSLVTLPRRNLTLATMATIPIDKSETTVTDIRIRGGGVREEFLDRMTEPDFFSDHGVWDGISIRGEGVLIVQVPSSLRDTIIKRFSDQGWFGPDAIAMAEDHIHQGIQKFIPAGSIYYIFDEHGTRWAKTSTNRVWQKTSTNRVWQE